MRLFLLRCWTSILLHKGASREDLGPADAVKQVLTYSLEEHPVRDDRVESNPLTPQEKIKRPFTAVLASPRGNASDSVWRNIYLVCSKVFVRLRSNYRLASLNVTVLSGGSRPRI